MVLEQNDYNFAESIFRPKQNAANQNTKSLNAS